MIVKEERNSGEDVLRTFVIIGHDGDILMKVFAAFLKDNEGICAVSKVSSLLRR